MLIILTTTRCLRHHRAWKCPQAVVISTPTSSCMTVGIISRE